MPITAPSPIQKRLDAIKRDAEERDAERRAQKFNHPYVNLGKVPISLEALRLVSAREAEEAKAAPIEIKTEDVAFCVYNPDLPETKTLIRKLESKQYKLKIFVVSIASLHEAWKLYKFIPAESGEITGKVSIEKKKFEGLINKLTNIGKVEEELKNIDFKLLHTTDLFEIILAGALANRASDIHFEAEEKKAKIRYRLDGLLHDIFRDLPLRSYDSLISRVKLLSGLKINVHSEPQDGRFTVDLPDKEVEVRVSIIPSEFGETIVMRVLDPDSIRVDLKDLGMRSDDEKIVKKQLKQPNGLILNTGPTGSGKTTTLYAFLKHIFDPEIKIITIEDPIEYRIEGIEQTQVDPEVGYTFASGLRSILRQDPDVILVGEIRDQETADIAMQASLTGHLVFSTLHTNDAIGAVPRLVDLGVKPTTIGPALSLVIAQRLVRKLCKNCKKEADVPADLSQKIKKFLDKLPPRVDKTKYESFKIYEPVGCASCNNLGYKGRLGIFEFLEVNTTEAREAILKDSSWITIKHLAESEGMVAIQEDGIIKVLSGDTSLKEVEEITGPIPW